MVIMIVIVIAFFVVIVLIVVLAVIVVIAVIIVVVVIMVNLHSTSKCTTASCISVPLGTNLFEVCVTLPLSLNDSQAGSRIRSDCWVNK